MIHKMDGVNRCKSMSVLIEESKESVSNKEKAHLAVKTYQRVHSVDGEGKLKREQMLAQEGYKLNTDIDNNSKCIFLCA